MKIEKRTREIERSLVARAARGDEGATRQLIDDTTPMIRAIARRLARSSDQLRDLVHEGVVGALHAISRFDASKNARFSTYARYWVRYYVQRAARRSRRITTLPRTRNMVKARHGMRRVKRALEQARGEPANAEEVAEILGVSVDDVAHAEMEHAGSDVSIDHPSHAGHCLELTSGCKDPETLMIEDGLARARRRAANQCLKMLSSRERYILEEHLLAPDTRTLRDIGASLGISRERVRQIESRALTRMRDRAAQSRWLLAS
jgi:RNA polymerase sigma factor (sigma-70 family)